MKDEDWEAVYQHCPLATAGLGRAAQKAAQKAPAGIAGKHLSIESVPIQHNNPSIMSHCQLTLQLSRKSYHFQQNFTKSTNPCQLEPD